MKTATIALACCIVAAIAGAAIAISVGASPSSQQAQRQQAFQPSPQQPAFNCSSCSLPGVQACIPSGLSLDCQQCYVNTLNQAGVTPYPISWFPNGAKSRWGYYAPMGSGNGVYYLDYCP